MGLALGGAAADGARAEYMLVDETSLVHVPPDLTDEEAAILPCAGLSCGQWHIAHQQICACRADDDAKHNRRGESVRCN